MDLEPDRVAEPIHTGVDKSNRDRLSSGRLSGDMTYRDDDGTMQCYSGPMSCENVALTRARTCVQGSIKVRWIFRNATVSSFLTISATSTMTETPPIDNSATMTAPPSLEYFRVTGIHSETTTEELISAVSAKFSDDEGDIQIEVSIVPQCDSTDDTKTGLVYFTKVPKFLDVLYNGDEETLVDTTIGELYFDKTFYGLTQLYPTTTQRKITAE